MGAAGGLGLRNSRQVSAESLAGRGALTPLLARGRPLWVSRHPGWVPASGRLNPQREAWGSPGAHISRELAEESWVGESLPSFLSLAWQSRLRCQKLG